MDFKKLFEDTKTKANEMTTKAIDFSSQKLMESKLTLETKEDLEKFQSDSKNKEFTSKETGETKTFTRRSIVIIGEEKTDFFKNSLYILPVIATKAFTQNVSVKLAKSDIKEFDYSQIEVTDFPSLVLFENEKVSKVITGEDAILKLVKSFDLDINKQIDNL